MTDATESRNLSLQSQPDVLDMIPFRQSVKESSGGASRAGFVLSSPEYVVEFSPWA